MLMRTLLIILLFCFSPRLFSQEIKRTIPKDPLSDTTYIYVRLSDAMNKTKMAVLDIGQKVIIYLRVDSLIKDAKHSLTYNVSKKSYLKIIHFLTYSSPKKDTIFVKNPSTEFEYLVSDQLQEGNEIGRAHV